MSEVKPQTLAHSRTLRHHHAILRPFKEFRWSPDPDGKPNGGKRELWSEPGVLTSAFSTIVADAGGSEFHRAAGLLFWKAG